jgi:hypothetical protein
LPGIAPTRREIAVDTCEVYTFAVGNVVPITVVAKLIGFRDINPAQLLEAAFAARRPVTREIGRSRRSRCIGSSACGGPIR